MFNTFAVSSLQRAEDANITGLKLMGGMVRDTAQDAVVFKTIFQDLKGFVAAKAVGDQDAWFVLR